MLNLTSEPITLIAESGSYTHEPSGYVARVETTRRNVGLEQVYFHGPDRLKYVEIPIIEETPTEIVVRVRDKHEYDLCTALDHAGEQYPELPDDPLLLVSREVAEAAAFLKHPLAERMVWASDPESNRFRNILEGVAYRALQRVPR